MKKQKKKHHLVYRNIKYFDGENTKEIPMASKCFCDLEDNHPSENPPDLTISK